MSSAPQPALRLVALDVDGTVLNSQAKLTLPVHQAILRLHQKGVQFVLISGRNLQSLKSVLDAIGLPMWTVTSGGAMAIGPGGTPVLFQRCMPQEDALAVIKIAQQHNASLLLENPGALYWEGSQEHFDWLVKELRIPVKMVSDTTLYVQGDLGDGCCGDPLKVTLMDTPERLEMVLEELKALDLDLHLAYSLPYYLEVTRAGVEKGSALQALAAHLGIPLAQIAAIGDGENDLGMFAAAGVSVAMGNAPPHVRAEANLVAPSNDEDGLAFALACLEEYGIAAAG